MLSFSASKELAATKKRLFGCTTQTASVRTAYESSVQKNDTVPQKFTQLPDATGFNYIF